MIRILIILLMSSCAHQVAPLRTSSGADAFYNESYLRWSRAELSDQQGHPDQLMAIQAQCYRTNAGGQSDYTTAQRNLAAHLIDNQDSPLYWNHVAACHIHHGQLAKAHFVLTYGLQKKGTPQQLSVLYNNLGLVSLKNRHFEQAKEHFERAHTLSPQSLVPRFNLAIVLLQFGHSHQAITHLEVVHRTNPKDQEVLSQLGIAYLLIGNHAQAYAYFNQLNEDYRRRGDLSAMMAINALKLGSPEQGRHILLRQGRTNDPFIRRMTQFTQRVIDQSLEQKRTQEEQSRRIATQSEVKD